MMADEVLAPAPAPPKAMTEARQHLLRGEFSKAGMSSRWFIGNLAVVAAAALFLLTAITLGLSVIRMLDEVAKTERAQIVLEETSDLQDAMTRSTNAARVYLLSHNPALLRDRKAAIASVIDHLTLLRTLVADDPQDSMLLAQTRQNIERRLALYDLLVVGRSTVIPAANESNRLGLARINDAQMKQLRDKASKDFRRAQQRVIAGMRLSMFLALVTGIASPLFGFIGIRLLRHERESQQARELRLELVHMQRLSIMGETSAMIAHEINQPLTAAGNYIAVARRLLKADTPDKVEPILDRTEEQIQRAGAILRKLRRFIEKRETERDLEDPKILIEDALALLSTIDGSVVLKTQIAPNLPQVMVDRVQLQQVLVNLMRNAIEAMSASPHRVLTLSVRETEPHAVEVTLADTGPGLTPEVAAKLFQPFVSTKDNGMGVGLSICHRIITQHGGRIWAEANPGGGTVFRFTIPAAEKRAAA